MAKRSPKDSQQRPRLMKTVDRDRLKRQFGKHLRKTRLRKGFSPTQFETLSGIEPANLRKYESGDRMPSVPTIEIMAKALGVKRWELMMHEFDW